MVENLANLANEMISWLQMIAVPATGVALGATSITSFLQSKITF